MICDDNLMMMIVVMYGDNFQLNGELPGMWTITLTAMLLWMIYAMSGLGYGDLSSPSGILLMLLINVTSLFMLQLYLAVLFMLFINVVVLLILWLNGIILILNGIIL